MGHIEYNDDSLMPWGKFRGKKLKDVPPWYFRYIVDKFKWGIMRPMGAESKALAHYIFSNDLYKSP